MEVHGLPMQACSLFLGLLLSLSMKCEVSRSHEQDLLPTTIGTPGAERMTGPASKAKPQATGHHNPHPCSHLRPPPAPDYSPQTPPPLRHAAAG